MSGDYQLGPHIYNGHYALLHHILTTHKPRHHALEFGVGAGESTQLIANRLPTTGFDSFKGLPEDWRQDFPAGTFAQNTIPDIPNTEIVVGLFEDTLPNYQFPKHIGLIHFDADLYSSTATALKYCAPHIHAGTILVFDEWHNYPGCEHHEQKAFKEHAKQFRWRVIGHSDQAWAIRII